MAQTPPRERSDYAPLQDEPSLDMSQFALLPTTQTTTVTTTTTVRTNYPPLLFKHLRRPTSDYDGSEYPLIGSATPSELKHFGFELDGMPATFTERGNAKHALIELQRTLASTDQSYAQATSRDAPNGSRKRRKSLTASEEDGGPASRRVKDRLSCDVEAREVRVPQPQRPSRRSEMLRDPASVPSVTAPLINEMGEGLVGVASPESLSLPSPSASPVAADALRVSPLVETDAHQAPLRSGQAANMLQLPVMLESFERLPANVQSYTIYQMLKRCNKNTLQLVASVVNPALKRDFLDLLPYELSLHVLSYLDVQSLCRALQVSKRWRQLIDEDEFTWKRRLDIDEYDIEDGDFEEVLEQGWIREPTSINSRRPRAPSSAGIERGSLSPFKEMHSDEAVFVRNHFQDMVDGGLKQPLVGQQVYKAIYRKHHTKNQRWLNPRKEPKHLSFESHGRHVVTCLQLDDDKIITGSEDSNINIFDAKTGALRVSLQGHEGGVWALQYLGNILVSGSTDRSVKVWDIPSGRCLQTYDGHTSTVRCLLICPSVNQNSSEHLIITGSRDSTLKIWKLPNAEDVPWQNLDPLASNPYWIRTLEGHTQAVRAIAAEDDILVSGSYDCSVRVWKPSTGKCLHRLTGHSQKVYSVVLDSKRNRCISGSMDWKVKVWAIDVGACLWTLEGHTSLVGLLSLSNEKLVSAAADSTLRVWDPNTGKCIRSLDAHTGAITCFQHDGDKIISGSDGTLKLWDARSGKFKRDLLSNLSYVWQVKFDDRRCVAAVQRSNMTFIEVLDFGA